MDYIAIIHKEAKSDYGVSFPDFPGCVTAGRTLDEAKDMAAEALGLHMEGMREDGLLIPVPSSLDAIMHDENFREGVAFLVSVPDSFSRIIRVNITVNEEDLKRIDAAAAAVGMKRSAYLVRSGLEQAR